MQEAEISLAVRVSQKLTASAQATAPFMPTTDATTDATTDTTADLGHTWLHPFLANMGFDPELVALCEQKLVRDEAIMSLERFAQIKPRKMTNEYLTSAGIEPLGVQEAILHVHNVAVECANARARALKPVDPNPSITRMLEAQLRLEERRREVDEASRGGMVSMFVIHCVMALLFFLLFGM